MNFTSEDWEILRHLGFRRKVNFSFGSYYTKGCNYKLALNELIGSYFAKKIGLISPNYKLVYFDDYYYVLSSEISFKTAEEMGVNEENLGYDLVRNILAERYNLKSEYEKMLLMNYLLGNDDLSFINWGINDNNHIVTLDFEMLFNESNITLEKIEGDLSYFDNLLAIILEEIEKNEVIISKDGNKNIDIPTTYKEEILALYHNNLNLLKERMMGSGRK